MKINYEKLLELENQELLEALGFIIQDFPIIGKTIIETFDDNSFELKKALENKEMFNFQYQYTNEGIYHIEIYFYDRLMFVFHSGEWFNCYSNDSCNFVTGKGIVTGRKTYKNFEYLLKNRYKDFPSCIENSKIDKILKFSKLNENFKEIKKYLK